MKYFKLIADLHQPSRWPEGPKLGSQNWTRRGHWGSLEEILSLLMKDVGPRWPKTDSETSMGAEMGPALGTSKIRPAVERRDRAALWWGLVESFRVSQSPGAWELNVCCESSSSFCFVKPRELWLLTQPEKSPGQVGSWLVSGASKGAFVPPFPCFNETEQLLNQIPKPASILFL